MTQKPDARRAPKPYSMNLRLTSPQWRGASMLAHSRGVSMAEIVRAALERELGRFKNADGVSFLAVLAGDEKLDLTADELADLVADEDDSADA